MAFICKLYMKNHTIYKRLCYKIVYNHHDYFPKKKRVIYKNINGYSR